MESPTIFDRAALIRKRKRAYQNIAAYNFLWDWTGTQISDRLKDIKRDFPLALEIGTRTPPSHIQEWGQIAKIEHLFHLDLIQPSYIPTSLAIGDEEVLPFGSETLDLIISNLTLHSVNDLPGALIQIRRALKPDGLFCAAMLGGETLWQLKEAFNHAELSLKGGLSPHIFPFADKQQMGGLMQRAGYALPVVDSDILTVTYPDIFGLMHDLRGMGEANIISARNKSYYGRRFFEEANTFYKEHFSDADGKLEAHFEIIFLIGWAPHESQQKPLRPGSAKTRLADALETIEIGTGETP